VQLFNTLEMLAHKQGNEEGVVISRTYTYDIFQEVCVLGDRALKSVCWCAMSCECGHCQVKRDIPFVCAWHLLLMTCMVSVMAAWDSSVG